MRLGQLIDTLAALDPDLPIRFDSGKQVGKIMSWRGVYAELTLTPAGVADVRPTVGAVDG